MTLTHAITQPQPLAWAQASGHCPVILSDTRPDLTRVGELMGIHASRERFWPGSTTWHHLSLGFDRTLEPEELDCAKVYGALVGVVRLVGVIRELTLKELSTPARSRYGMALGRAAGALVMPVSEEDSERIRPWWRSGTKWGLLLSEAVLLPEPIPMRGSGGVWHITTENSAPGTGYAADARTALEQWRKARAGR